MAAGIFAAGAVVCGIAALVRAGKRPARLVLAAALVAGAVAALGDADSVAWHIAIGLGTAGLALVVLERFDHVSVLSWMDAVMVGCAVAGLAVFAGLHARPAMALAGAAGGLALSRWQPSPCMLLVAGGVALLGAGDPGIAVAAAPLMAAGAWQIEARVDAGPDFRWTVLATLVGVSVAALTLLGVNQFLMLSSAAGVLAIITVLVGIARAGVTVARRIRESDRMARRDELTGLANRRHLLDRLDLLVARGEPLALLLIDLDGFKELNDTLGHHAGDEVLRQIGPRLAHAVRDHDLMARLGGDEFALVLAPGDEEAASTAGLRLRAALEDPFRVEEIRVHINASVGIALHPEHARTALGLLQRSDIAMYEAKRKRTGHEVYLPAGDGYSRDRLALVGELGTAIEAGQLVLHYQPKASLATGEVNGVEALVRWNHPQRGLLMPGEFLPLVEHSGLTRALTAHVIGEAVAQVRQWRSEGLGLSVAVNLGPADLLDLGLPAEVASLLVRSEFPSGMVQLEVSEDVVMADPERTIDVLNRLRRLGVGIALDDFGAGTSSLSHLRLLELDELKIDRSFVLAMRESESDGAIVRSAIDLGHRLGLRVVAEGVTTEETWDLLGEWGCEEAQGFLLAGPMPAAEMRAWLDAREVARFHRAP